MSKVIAISEEVYALLDSRKIHHRESFSDVIARTLGLVIIPPSKSKKPKI